MDRGLELCYEPVDVKGGAVFIPTSRRILLHFVAARDSTWPRERHRLVPITTKRVDIRKKRIAR